jgi:hypothetical protein
VTDPQNPYAAPQAELTLAPGERWAREMSPSLRRTGLGLALVYYGIILMLLSSIAMFVLPFVLWQGGGLHAMGTANTAVLIAGLGLVLASILIFVGPLVCLAVPADTGAKRFLIGSVVFQMANVAYAIGGRFAPRLATPVVGIALAMLGLVGFVLFVLFMKRLSEYIGRRDLAARARNVLIGLGITIALGTLVVLRPLRGSSDLGLLVIPLLIAVIVVFVMYANLVNWLRKALRGR